jgi:Kazal-type serine protease inhibitor domain
MKPRPLGTKPTGLFLLFLLFLAVPAVVSAGGLLVGPAAAEAGAKCGGPADPACAGNEFCDKPAGACSLANAEGACVRVSQLCFEVYLPVCGCDGKTYSNDCERQRAKASKAHDGKCG